MNPRFYSNHNGPWPIRLSLCFSLCVLTGALVPAGEGLSQVHVAAGGDDQNGDGSAEKPFATLAAAIKKLPASGDADGMIIISGEVFYTGVEKHTRTMVYEGHGEGAALRFEAGAGEKALPPSLAGPSVFRKLALRADDPDGLFSFAHALTLENLELENLSMGGDLSVTRRPEYLRLLDAKVSSLRLGGRVDHPRWGALSGGNTVELDGGAIDVLYVGNSPKNDQLFDGDLNVLIRRGGINRLTDEGRKIGWIKGGLQVIVEHGAAAPSVEIKNRPAKGIWILRADSKDGALTFTESAGRFRLLQAKSAIATRAADRKIFHSEGEALILPAGEYRVAFPESPAYVRSEDGTGIKVLTSFNIDFTTLSAPDAPGKLFLGWVDAAGEGIPDAARLETGSVLKAVFVDTPQDAFVLDEVSLSNADPAAPSIRFHLKNNLVWPDNAPVAEVGVIAIPKLYSRHEALTLDGVYRFPWDKGEEFRPRKLEAVNGYYEVAVPEALDYTREYAARGYLSFIDFNGFSRCLYTPERRSSVVKLAPELRAAARQAYYAGGSSPLELRLEEGLGNEKAHILKPSGLTVVEVELDSGNDFDAPVEIVAWGDNHFRHINALDAENLEIMYADRRRGQANPIHRAAQSAQTLMEYASLFEQSVVLGDNIDFYCHGGLEVWRDLIQNGDPGLMATLGYHDYVTYTVSGRPLREFDMKAARQSLEPYYNNDTTYAAKTLQDKVRVVVLDNSRAGQYYWSDRIHEKLAADIVDARQKGQVIVLFQHEGLYLNTNGPDPEKDKESRIRHGFVKDAKHEGKVMDYAKTGSRFDGKENPGYDQVRGTKAVYKLIVENADVIRGVFHGHVHSCYASEIRARDPDGREKTIPQYSSHGSVFYDNGFAIKITVR